VVESHEQQRHCTRRQLTATQNAPESEKAQRYIQQLDDARCASRWQDIPELCRKVEKHAPHRKCWICPWLQHVRGLTASPGLTHTARSEAQIAAFSTQRPSTAASTASHGLSHIIPSLLSTIEGEGELSQDAFQANVCLGWLHYVLDEPGLAVARLPKDIGASATRFSQEGSSLSGWTRVCVIKGTYLKGACPSTRQH
jgi:hypothetical protein